MLYAIMIVDTLISFNRVYYTYSVTTMLPGMSIQFLTFSRYFWRIFHEDVEPNWYLDKALCLFALCE